MPLPMAVLLPLIMQGASMGLGALGQNRANSRNQRRQSGLDQQAQGMMGQGPGDAEQMLMQFLQSGFDPAQSTGEGYNAGQDSLMQMLRAPAIDTESLFNSWTPIEKRQMDESLSNFWGTQGGLGQRFGSAAARETGRVRGQAAENAIGRRAETSYGAQQFNAQQRMGAASQLQQGGNQQAQMALQAWMGRMGGMQSVAGMEGGRRNADMQMLMAMMGMGGGNQPNAIPGAMGDFGQLMMMLPMLQQMMGPAGMQQKPSGGR